MALFKHIKAQSGGSVCGAHAVPGFTHYQTLRHAQLAGRVGNLDPCPVCMAMAQGESFVRCIPRASDGKAFCGKSLQGPPAPDLSGYERADEKVTDKNHPNALIKICPQCCEEFHAAIEGVPH